MQVGASPTDTQSFALPQLCSSLFLATEFNSRLMAAKFNSMNYETNPLTYVWKTKTSEWWDTKCSQFAVGWLSPYFHGHMSVDLSHLYHTHNVILYWNTAHLLAPYIPRLHMGLCEPFKELQGSSNWCAYKHHRGQVRDGVVVVVWCSAALVCCVVV